MNARARSRAVVGLQWIVGLVLIIESLRFAFAPSAARHFARTGMPLWMRPALAWTEIAAAILFLVPFTTLLGGYLLLVIFFLAASARLAWGVRRRRPARLCHGGAGEHGLPERNKIGNNT